MLLAIEALVCPASGGMAATDQVVDLSENPVAARKRRRRAIIRIGVPVLGVVLVIAAILGIALYSEHVNRRGALALSDQLLTTLDRQIAERVASFLSPGARSLEVLRLLFLRTPPAERRAVGERFAASAMHQIPQISSFFVGDSDGNFIMVRRGERAEVMEVKEIVTAGSQRQVILTEQDETGKELSRREDPQDEFDPRTRPWYRGALETDGTFWTDIYIFYTDKKPGLTASSLLHQDGTDYVFGADISLDELSTFLASLDIGETGRAFIVDRQGQLIAGADSGKLVNPVGEGEEVEPLRLDEIGDPVLTAAYDRFRVEGRGRRVLEVDGERYVSSTALLSTTGRDWWVLILVPESDFTGFVSVNHRQTLLMSLVIVVAVGVLAFLLFRQSLRYERSLRRMAEQSSAISQQSSAYAAIAQQTERQADAEGGLPPVVTETLTSLTNARRVSVWRLGGRGQVLHCDDSFDTETRRHAEGFQLQRREMPRFFDMLESGEETEIADAAGDSRSAVFFQNFMQPFRSRSLLVLPLRRGDQVIGMLGLENAKAFESCRNFVHTVAAIATLQMEKMDEGEPERAVQSVQAEQSAPQERSQILPADLALPEIDRSGLGAELYSGVAVMVLRFSGRATLARKAEGNGLDLADLVAQALQAEASERGVRYLKFVSQQVVAAEGLEDDAETAMSRVAALAVALRERCVSLFEAAGHGGEFRIGLDYGMAFGCGIGDEPRQFNMWGDAFETAEALAHSAAPGAIQASEAAYARLRHDFLLRPRGRFYIPGVGEARTFVLAGQL